MTDRASTVNRQQAPSEVPPNRPDITPAQIVSGIPILAEFLHAFGVYDLSPEQVDSLGKATLWALALLGSDAVIRLARNLARR